HAAYYGRGLVLKEKGELDKALADFDKAIEANSAQSAYYEARGGVHYAKRDYKAAIQDFTQAFDRSGKRNMEALYNRAVAMRLEGQCDRAAVDLDVVIRNKQDAGAFYNRGLCYRDLKDYDKAIQDFSAAIRLDSKNPAIFTDRGIAYIAKGDYDKAIED